MSMKMTGQKMLSMLEYIQQNINSHTSVTIKV